MYSHREVHHKSVEKEQVEPLGEAARLRHTGEALHQTAGSSNPKPGVQVADRPWFGPHLPRADVAFARYPPPAAPEFSHRPARSEFFMINTEATSFTWPNLCC